MIKPILDARDLKLRIKSKPVIKFDKKTKLLIKDLKDTLRVQDDPEGIGLAAPQIGKNTQVFVMKPKEEMTVVVNPKIISVEKLAKKNPKKKLPKTMEGCLSLPHYYGPLRRSKKVKIKYLDEEGKDTIRSFEGLEAQIVLHEIDHLNGVLFVDRLLENRTPLYELIDDEWHEVDLLL